MWPPDLDDGWQPPNEVRWMANEVGCALHTMIIERDT